jgi:hypothetical protein
MGPKKKTTKKPPAKRVRPKRKSTAKKTAAANRKKQTARAEAKSSRGGRRSAFAARRSGKGSQAGMQSGDLQGLSVIQDVDSESVGELLEEGNALEAGVVEGVEEAGSHSQREVQTHEMPEDDVPEEYRNRDK